jgi:FKBP-type peptidyl-prolyl cis-trans isomerase 2
LFPAEYEPVIREFIELYRMINQIMVFTGYIHSFDDSVVRVDLNHPMAGKLLKFDTEIVWNSSCKCA